ncbi:putative lysophospholipase BODYGUARD 4 isoform X1 [Iris pallida]|uniref:Lysophospholipase BODYGUARD 4 isoform X1 n=1 Tax=Iris pallida TaxID=29817 RepID=A0AAX6G2H4_IRIPA|nr:putative lysophospholipase BODYGUARD 4 isoform X1 [Iris pallida]
MFAVDLLGFGKSPKPTDGLYTIEDHIDMIEISVLKPFQVNSFHIVAHSMGCVIALALAAKYPQMVKSVTLVAAPYFPSTTRAKASETTLNRLAERKIWPPFLFGASVMSWYEHLGRTICFLVCRNHLTWEWIIKLVTRRDVHFMMIDLTKHTHHSAWHTMHNVICGAANSMDEYLKVMKIAGTPFKVLQGSKDQLVPHECSFNIKVKVPHAELHVITGANHSTVIIGREKAFTRELEEFWFSSTEHGMHKIECVKCLFRIIYSLLKFVSDVMWLIVITAEFYIVQMSLQ